MSISIPADTPPLVVGGSASGQFGTGYQNDWFKLTLTAGQTYRFSMSDAVGSGGNLPDLESVLMDMVDSGGNLLDRESFAASDLGPIMEFTPTVSGIYYLFTENMGGIIHDISYKINATVAAPDDFADSTATAGVLSAGGRVHGNFEVAGDRDVFRFHANLGEHYSFSYSRDAGELPILAFRVYDASGKLLMPAGVSTGFDAPASGDYYVSVEGGSFPSKYTLVSTVTPDDYPQNAATTGVLALGRQVSGKIEYNGDVDRFKLPMQAGTTYSFELSSSLPKIDSPLSFLMFDSAGNSLAPIITRTASGAMDYTVRAGATGVYYADISDTGSDSGISYTLAELSATADDYGDTIGSASKIAVGTTTRGVLQSVSDIDMFRADLVAGTTYTIALQPQSGSDQLKLTLSGADGVEVAEYSVSAYSAEKFFTFTPTASASYYLAASTSSAGMPAYALSVSKTVDDVGANAASAGHLAIGGAVHGELEKGGGDLDWYAVTLAAGQTYLFTLSGSREGNGTLGAGQGQLQVLDAQGHVVSMPQSSDYLNTAPELSFAAASSGTYYVQVAGVGRATGTYALQAQVGVADDVGNDPQHATHIDIGKTQNGVMEVARDVDVYAIDVVAGTTYGLTRIAPGAPYGESMLQLSVSDASQANVSLVSVGNGAHVSEFFTASTTGTYYVTVAGSGSNGSPAIAYTLTPLAYTTDDFSADTTTTGRLAVNGTLHGSFDYPGDADYVRVHLDAGSSYVFQLQDGSQSAGAVAGIGAGLTLFDGSGHTVLATSNHNYTDFELNYTAAATGDYYIDAHALTGLNTAYTLGLTQTSGDAAPPVLVGGTPSGNLGLADSIYFTFNEAVRQTSDGAMATSLINVDGYAGPRNEPASVSIVGDTLVVDPGPNLMPGTTYTVNLSGLTDLAGNAYAPTSLTFTTVPVSTQGGDGDDYLISNADGKTIDGGAGIDTVYSPRTASGDAYLGHDADGHWTLFRTGTPGDTLVNVERIMFYYGAVALDIDGHAGQAYRLYQAAFDRAPDQAGLGYWMDAMDKGTSLHDVADSFVHSAEFATLYGAATTDAQFLTLLYNNVLHRAPDAGGAAYWTDAFQHGLTRPDALTSFSESAENQAAVIGQIADGISYTPYHA